VSSDNLYLIRRAAHRYGVSMEFASSAPDPDETNPLERAVAEFYYPTPIDSPSITWFDTKEDAVSYAHSEYSEYGVELDVEEDSSNDTIITRLQRLLRAGATTPEDSLVLINDHDNNASILHWGLYQIRVEGPSFKDASALAAWITAVRSIYED
jgi:hypothetical protein